MECPRGSTLGKIDADISNGKCFLANAPPSFGEINTGEVLGAQGRRIWPPNCLRWTEIRERVLLFTASAAATES